MPIYEYICEECRNPFERIVLSKTERIACPKCGSERNIQRYSVVNTVAKGGDGANAVPMGGGCCGPGGCGCG